MIQRNLKKALNAIRRAFNPTPSTSKPWTWAYRDSDGNWQWEERPISTIEDIRASFAAAARVEDGVVKAINVTSVSIHDPGDVYGGAPHVDFAPAPEPEPAYPEPVAGETQVEAVVEDGVVKEINVVYTSRNYVKKPEPEPEPAFTAEQKLKLGYMVGIFPDDPEPEPVGPVIDWDHVTMDVYYGHLRDSEWMLALYRMPHRGVWHIAVTCEDRYVSHMDHTFQVDTTMLAQEYATDWALRIKGLTDRTTNMEMLRNEEN